MKMVDRKNTIVVMSREVSGAETAAELPGHEYRPNISDITN